MKSIQSRSFGVLLVILLSFTSLAVLNVKAQPTPIPVSGNWSKVAIFTGERSGITTESFTCDHVEWRINWKVDTTHMHFNFANYILQITTFPEDTINDYIDFINGSFSSIYDPTNHRAGGTSYIHDNAGTFYMRIKSSPYVDSYRVIVEQNTDSPIPSPTPTPIPTPTSTPWIYEYRGFYIEQADDKFIVSENYLETYISPLFSTIEEAKEWIESGPTTTPNPSDEPTPTPLPPIRFYNPYLILFGTTLLLIALGILAYFKKHRRRV